MYIKHTNQPTLRSIHNGCFIFGYICGGGKAVKISLFYISRKSTDQENLSRFPNLLVSIIFCQIRHHWSGWQAMTVQTSTRNLLNKLKFQTIIQDLSNIYILIRELRCWSDCHRESKCWWEWKRKLPLLAGLAPIDPNSSFYKKHPHSQ